MVAFSRFFGREKVADRPDEGANAIVFALGPTSFLLRCVPFLEAVLELRCGGFWCHGAVQHLG